MNSKSEKHVNRVKQVTREVLGMHAYSAYNGELKVSTIVSEVLKLVTYNDTTYDLTVNAIYAALPEYGPVGDEPLDDEWLTMGLPKPSRITTTQYRVGER